MLKTQSKNVGVYMKEEVKHRLLTVQDAFKKYPKQCKIVLDYFGYLKVENDLWMVPDDQWLDLEGAGHDVSYCISDEKWISHADLLMCALYYILQQEKDERNPIELDRLYRSKDPLSSLLELVDIYGENKNEY